MKHKLSATPQADVAIIIGRWQIHHRGHEGLRRTALALAPKVIIVIGSAWHSRDSHNPFTAAERQQQIEAVLSPEELARVEFLPIRDYYDNERWKAAVVAGVAKLTERTDKITLVGFKKDHTSSYLDDFQGWSFHETTLQHEISATELRRVYFETADMGTALTIIGNYVEPGILAYLEAWSKLPVYQRCATEHKAVASDRRDYPAPFYLTADSIVRFGDQILLIKRGGKVGHGLFALPGGFLEPREQFYPSAVRELGEETNYRPLAFTLRAALKGQAVFDHPQRSARGRLVTTAFYFDFGGRDCPEVQAKDDAMEVGWFAIKDLAAMEDRLFEDHACILDHFLGVFGEGITHGT